MLLRISLTLIATLGLASSVPAQQILETYDPSLTSFLPSGSTATAVQGIRPNPLQRGVGIDGSLRAPPPLAMALAGNPFESAWVGKESQGDLRLDLGAYSPLDIDIALPSTGVSWVVGRSYNARQVDASGNPLTSNGYQGRNWQQTSQPEIMLFLGGSHSDDVLYLVYRADAYIEFRSTNSSGTRFKGKNGAAGVVEFVAGGGSNPDTFVYHAQNGTAFTFLGFNSYADPCKGLLWKIVDEDGNTAFVGDSSSASTAISNGWDGSGRITTAFDSADRRYTYSYTTYDSVLRLTEVKAETKSGGTWSSPTGLSEVARVNYDYYGDESNGDKGDLKKVTITTPLSDSGVNQTKKQYYRYWEGSSDNVASYDATTNPGYPHEIMLVLGFEGARRFDLAWGDDQTLDEDYTLAKTTVAPSDLEPYATAYLAYNSSRQVKSAFFNGVCGCSGGSSGMHGYSYSAITYTNNTGYDAVVASRTITARPDGSYLTQYFDEVGQGMGQIVTDVDPSSGGTVKKWATWPERDAMGCVSYLHLPDNLSSYTHSTGTFAPLTTTGVVQMHVRESSGNQKGFLSVKKVKLGDGTTPHSNDSSGIYVGKVTWDVTTLSKTYTDTAATVVRPLVSTTRVYPEPGTSDADYLETAYTYVAYSSTLVFEKVTKTDPTVAETTNGSGSATISSMHYLKSGLVDYEKDEQGLITYHVFTNGQETTRIEDADTSSPTPPSGFSSSGDELKRQTTTELDPQGRVISQTLHALDSIPVVPKTYRSKLADERMVVLHFTDFASSSSTYYGPVRFEVVNQAGKTEASGVIALTSNITTSATSDFIDENQTDPLAAIDLGTVAQMHTTIFDSAGALAAEDRGYFLVPTTGVGTEGTNYDSTRYGYDGMGRRWRTKEASGTIRRTVFDAIGRQSESWIGTNDNSGSFPGGETSGTENMFKTDVREYDLGADKGKSLLTTLTLRVNSSSGDDRVTTYKYDWRGRRIVTLPPTAPYTVAGIDNLGRTVAIGQYSSSSGLDETANPTDPDYETNRLALSESVYDEMGRVWKSIRHKIHQSNGSDDDTLNSLTWFDEKGRTIKVRGEDYRKTIYDRLGRVTDEYTLTKDNDSAYADATGAAGDIVLEEYQTRYDGTKPDVLLSVTLQRKHNDISTGETAGRLYTYAEEYPLKVTAANLKGRAQITANWYDRLGRVEDTVQYGTNGDNDLDRAGLSVPSRSVTALRTSTVYNTDGTVKSTEDPSGLKAYFEYDAEGRLTKEVRNWDSDESPVPTGTDVNVTVAYGYTNGLRTSLTAVMPSGGGDDQVTTYTFGTVKDTNPGDSMIATGHLLQKVAYPDSTGGTDVVTYAYNAQGQEIWKEDQAGNVLESVYDDSGRRTINKATTIASGFDDAVKRVETGYDSLGRTSSVVQYNATSSGSATDGVAFTYDDWGNVLTYAEDRDSVVSGGGNQYTTSYTYEEATAGRYTLRRTGATLPGSRAITYRYSSTGGKHDDESSRVTSLLDGTVTLAKYDYLGVGTVVRTYLSQISCMSRVYDDSTPVSYADLENFNRVTTSRWTKDLSTDRDFYQVALTYDEDSNITSADDKVHGGYDVLYTMDSVNRLTEAAEGTLSGSSITDPTRDEQWTLSHTGNWDHEKLNLNGDTDFTDAGELDETRTHNEVNELLTRDTDNDTDVDYSPAYDAVGNMTDDAKNYKYVYDVWGRLRKVKQTGSSMLWAEYRYNGLNHRIGIHENTDESTELDSNDKWYYDAFDERWRQLARYRESDSSPKEDFVPHQAGANGGGGSSYIDLVICRNRDESTAWTSASDGTLETRSYLCQNWRADVSAVVKLVGSSGTELREWVKYSAYGTPIGLPGGDTESDGDCDPTDVTQVHNWWYPTPAAYDVRGDIDLDGAVDSDDETIINGSYSGITLGRGVLSATNVVNRKGYAGYEQLSALTGGKWLARNRVLAADLGRWMQRDPIGYSDGADLYEYVGSQALILFDTSGLEGGPATGNPWDPGTHVDPPKDPPPGDPPKKSCCEEAFTQGMKKIQPGKTIDGTMICCKGTKIICVYTNRQPSGRPGSILNAVAERVADCVKQHEEFHYWNSRDCETGETEYDLGGGLTGNHNEWMAYWRQWYCLLNINCGNLVPLKDPQRRAKIALCEKVRQSAIDNTLEQKAAYHGFWLKLSQNLGTTFVTPGPPVDPNNVYFR